MKKSNLKISLLALTLSCGSVGALAQNASLGFDNLNFKSSPKKVAPPKIAKAKPATPLKNKEAQDALLKPVSTIQEKVEGVYALGIAASPLSATPALPPELESENNAPLGMSGTPGPTVIMPPTLRDAPLAPEPVEPSLGNTGPIQSTAPMTPEPPVIYSSPPVLPPNPDLEMGEQPNQ